MTKERPYINQSGSTLSHQNWLDHHHSIKSRLRSSLIRQIHFRNGEQVLELGCGPGHWSMQISEQIGIQGKLVGIDLDENSIQKANDRAHILSKKNVYFEKCGLEEFLQNCGKFDTILAFNVLSYTKDPKEVIFRALKKLQNGGRLIIKDSDIGTDFYWPVCPKLFGLITSKLLETKSNQILVGNYNPIFSRTLPSILNSIQNIKIDTYSQSFTVAYPLLDEEIAYIRVNANLISEILSKYKNNESIIQQWNSYFKASANNIFQNPDFIYSMTEFIFQLSAKELSK